MTQRSQVQEARLQLVASVRAFVEGQIETWQLVPWLALQADGRDGGMGHYIHAYEHGMWELRIANDKLFYLFIDCGTGAILSRTYQGAGRGFRPVSDDQIVRLSNHLDDLDAQQVVAKLRAQIEKPRPSWISHEQADDNEADRVRIQHRLGLGKRYVRTGERTAA